MNNLPISVIISTYNSEDWLRKVLEGYKHQMYDNYEVIVADDGSGASTKAVIESYQADYPVPLRHIWHEDEGYRRQELLNKVIMQTEFDYILMTDGDCIPRNDFIAVHAKYAERGYFLSGGYCKLNMALSKTITTDDIANENCFDVKWLKQQDKLGAKQAIKISAGDTLATFLDFITPTGATFNNCNSSAWKQDLIDINGYDERMQYGGPDRELGERLMNFGIKTKQIRHKAICLHLDHKRGYKTKESLERNLKIRKDVKDENKVWTDYGIVKK
ncbi:glycosyltransferase family 2 protein [Ichthyenterobacterium sp. W332]|uniref:Glycosyltransferase family 2 protein n=1 Tax=Microcosmobacter mediterraneus TaxID=3075607 RepID=A0ABU2YN89_9FLAO|nr:glycosyltransferase family 2 protein [Ichthyenterobacterium sp. W332]MDT0559512.1 glycosyltransferase family 2 protein [Ichthyenterobacterium sp. W332]